MERTIVIAFFIVSICAVVPVLYYYQRKNPDPRFRPRFGEMMLMSILAFGFCTGGAIFMGSIMGVNWDPEKMKQQLSKPSSGGSDDDDDGMFGGGQQSDEDQMLDTIFGSDR